MILDLKPSRPSAVCKDNAWDNGGLRPETESEPKKYI